MRNTPARLALLDLYEGTPNQGMRCIRALLDGFADALTYEEFDVRGRGEVPDASYDLYLVSGGPGSPLASGEEWETRLWALLDEVWAYNLSTADASERKHAFFICHGFQLACRYFGSARLQKRRSMSFGTFPVHPTNSGEIDPIFAGLGDPFYVADFREYQVVQANFQQLAASGGNVLAYEKIRLSVPYERAVMAIRWSDEFVGTQFHPEADSDGMVKHFNDPERKAVIVDEHGADKFAVMMAHLGDPDKVARTNQTVIPNFLRAALHALRAEPVAVA